MSTPVVSYESRDSIAIITLNRPEKRNAINNEVALQLREALERLNESDDRAGVITHAGAHFKGDATIQRIRQSSNAKEGVASFKVKRKPRFTGK